MVEVSCECLSKTRSNPYHSSRSPPGFNSGYDIKGEVADFTSNVKIQANNANYNHYSIILSKMLINKTFTFLIRFINS